MEISTVYFKSGKKANYSNGTGVCIDCGVVIDIRAKRCRHCARMLAIKGSKAMNLRTEDSFKKGHGLLYDPKGLSKHHIWYEFNDGVPTDRGIMLVTRGHHSEIHSVLRHNLWTDNRRYLAG